MTTYSISSSTLTHTLSSHQKRSTWQCSTKQTPPCSRQWPARLADKDCHRPSFKVSVNSLFDNGSEEALLESGLFTTKAGCLGLGRFPFSLPSMTTTFDIVGRSFGSSCTHNSPTLKHLKNSFSLQVSLNGGSIKSSALFSFHSFHACNTLGKSYQNYNRRETVGFKKRNMQ